MIRFRLAITELGEERQCRCCGEWWPHDAEFFGSDGHGGRNSWCLACIAEQKAISRARRRASRETVVRPLRRGLAIVESIEEERAG